MSSNKLSFKEEIVDTIVCGLALTGRWIREYNSKRIGNYKLRFGLNEIYLLSTYNNPSISNHNEVPILITKKQLNKLLGYRSIQNLYINVKKVYRNEKNLIKAEIIIIQHTKYAKKKFAVKTKLPSYDDKL